jgi:hypothetical protein
MGYIKFGRMNMKKKDTPQGKVLRQAHKAFTIPLHSEVRSSPKIPI